MVLIKFFEMFIHIQKYTCISQTLGFPAQRVRPIESLYTRAVSSLRKDLTRRNCFLHMFDPNSLEQNLGKIYVWCQTDLVVKPFQCSGLRHQAPKKWCCSPKIDLGHGFQFCGSIKLVVRGNKSTSFKFLERTCKCHILEVCCHGTGFIVLAWKAPSQVLTLLAL